MLPELSRRPLAWHRRPILVSGMPRSGTTWLGRLLGGSPGTALVGREPMNPHVGQYRLGGTLTGWASLDSFSATQLRALRTAYWGVNPFVFGRYGRRQWAAPAPWTRVVVKDPFAMLSLPAIIEATGAVVVLLYRHPGAALASYRRMGWHPDLTELRPLLQAHRASRVVACAGDEQDDRELAEPVVPPPETAVTAEQMARFWSGLYEIAMDQVEHVPGADVVVVSHEELAGGGVPAARRLFDRLGLSLGPRSVAELQRAPATEAQPHTTGSERLHNFNRSSAAVAHEWRSGLDAAEVATVEQLTRASLARVAHATLNLS